MKKETIAFDLDGTLAHYTEWKGLDHIGDPLPGTVKVVNKLVDLGYDVVIFTTRTNPEQNKEPVEQLKQRIYVWLDDNGFSSEVRVTEYKPIALLYVDDHCMGIEANSDWTDKTLITYLKDTIKYMKRKKK